MSRSPVVVSFRGALAGSRAAPPAAFKDTQGQGGDSEDESEGSLAASSVASALGTPDAAQWRCGVECDPAIVTSVLRHGLQVLGFGPCKESAQAAERQPVANRKAPARPLLWARSGLLVASRRRQASCIATPYTYTVSKRQPSLFSA